MKRAQGEIRAQGLYRDPEAAQRLQSRVYRRETLSSPCLAWEREMPMGFSSRLFVKLSNKKTALSGEKKIKNQPVQARVKVLQNAQGKRGGSKARDRCRRPGPRSSGGDMARGSCGRGAAHSFNSLGAAKINFICKAAGCGGAARGFVGKGDEKKNRNK